VIEPGARSLRDALRSVSVGRHAPALAVLGHVKDLENRWRHLRPRCAEAAVVEELPNGDLVGDEREDAHALAASGCRRVAVSSSRCFCSEPIGSPTCAEKPGCRLPMSLRTSSGEMAWSVTCRQPCGHRRSPAGAGAGASTSDRATHGLSSKFRVYYRLPANPKGALLLFPWVGGRVLTHRA
jgi:hypothetical protein